MGAKVYADCLSDEGVSSSPDLATLPEEPSEETDVQAVAAWFEALPDEWRSYFDREAESGQRAYGPA